MQHAFPLDRRLISITIKLSDVFFFIDTWNDHSRKIIVFRCWRFAFEDFQLLGNLGRICPLVREGRCHFNHRLMIKLYYSE